MEAAAAARRATASARAATQRKPRSPRRSPAPKARARQVSAGRVVRPALAGAALFPQAAMRSAGAVRDFSDSSLIIRLTRGRGWIAVLCALLGGIVALNVLSLSLTAGSGRTSLQIDALNTEISTLQAQIDERLSAIKVEAEATRLGLANPDPEAITFLSAADADVRRLAHLLATDSFLLAPSQPSSYPAPGTSYAPVPTTSPATTAATTTTSAPQTSTAPSSTAPPSSGGAEGGSSGSDTSSGSSGGTTGGVGL